MVAVDSCFRGLCFREVQKSVKGKEEKLQMKKRRPLWRLKIRKCCLEWLGEH